MSVPPPSEIETGVSNGDVDWLFRGKSKKLVKQLNSEKKLSIPETEPADTEKQSTKPQQSCPGPEPKPSAKAPDTPKSPSVKEGAAPSPSTPKPTPPPPVTTTSGRSRSSSLPQSVKNEPRLSQQASSSRRGSETQAPSATGAIPIPNASNAQNSALSRSNSGKGRSFLSSLSSKFLKSPSFSAPSTSPNGNVPLMGTSPTSAPMSHSPKSAPDPKSSFKDKDLASFVSKPPPEMGFPLNTSRSSRKSSLVSLSPRSSVDRDRGGIFRRKSSVSEQSIANAQLSYRAKASKGSKNFYKINEPPKQLLARVTFALDKLDDDPQQQIPSRRPRKGNVLIPEDLKAPVPRLAQGISSTDGSKAAAVTENQYTEKEIQMAIEAQSRALLEAEKHAMEAHLSAKKLAAQIANHKGSSKISQQVLEEEVSPTTASNFAVDMPLHMHENYFESEESTAVDEEVELTLDAIYTRCCHLREILPIPATLKQLKDKSRPLQVLKLLNPKPTLIDVLSFSDFIAITPINTVIFDNVTMTTEMLKHLLASLVHSKHLEKLSLRNVAIDDCGWEYLCEFLRRNLSVKKLDVSQQRVKQLTKQTSFRSAMNWDLFIKALQTRGGIEELVMGGCKLSDETFERLLENAISLSTYRLGVAGTEINVRKCEMLADWISRPNSKCVGIDIAYNDLSGGQLQPFIETFNTKEVKLFFFSLNSTSLTDVDEVTELLRGLTNIKTLRFLDLSSLPQLFPEVIPKLRKYLPQFPTLKRVHFDLNELTSQSISAIADFLPKVQSLVHVSLLGNKDFDRGSIGALYTAVKSSAIFALDLDYGLVPDELSQRLALYFMRNLDRTIRPDINNLSGANEEDDVMFDGSLLMETAEKMLRENDENSGEVDLKLQKIITNALIERTNSVRKEMHKIIDVLFEKRTQGNLSFEGKENLLRFCLLDASLEKVVHMFKEKAKSFSSTALSPTSSIHEIQGQSISENLMKGSERDDQDQLHESSSAMIDAGPILMAKTSRPNNSNASHFSEYNLEPHLVVLDADSGGKNVPIDNLTGRPVLMKSVSQTSVHAKQQEEEEGEFLRWGFFMEQRDEFDERAFQKIDDKQQDIPVFGALPSGSELREAIINAKGIDSVTDLISKINNSRVSLDNIYQTVGLDPGTVDRDTLMAAITQKHTLEDLSDRSQDDVSSIDSNEQDVDPVVHEAYEKLLNEAQRVRSNK